MKQTEPSQDSRGESRPAEAPDGAPPVETPVGADWTHAGPLEPADEAQGVREDQPPAPEAVQRDKRQSRFPS